MSATDVAAGGSSHFIEAEGWFHAILSIFFVEFLLSFSTLDKSKTVQVLPREAKGCTMCLFF